MATKLTVDHDACTGCGMCIDIAPELFQFGDDGMAYAKTADDPDQALGDEAIDACPVDAISWKSK